MLTFAAASLTCWLCVLIVTPRKPRCGDEVQELVYTRLLGRHHLLVFFAAAITAGTLLTGILAIPMGVHADLEQFRASCLDRDSGSTRCGAYESGKQAMVPVATVPAFPCNDPPSFNQRAC